MRFYEITFLNPSWFSFKPGFNTTLIYGERDYKNIIKILDESTGLVYIKFKNPATLEYKLAQLMSIERLYYSQVSVTDSASNHLVRTKDQLDNLMRASYGKYFNDDSVITLIGFYIQPE